ncbi:hypothetical protein, partial [Actinobacillus pleuropneumoniae]
DVRFRNVLGIPPLKRFLLSSRVFNHAKFPNKRGIGAEIMLIKEGITLLSELRGTTSYCILW